MTGLDAKFLYSETRTAHMHTIKVAVSNVSAVEGGFSYDALTEVLGQLLVRLPPFRRRVVPVPWGLGHPVWVEDPKFDLRHHLSRRVLDHPGGNHQLAAAVAAFAGIPLGRDRLPHSLKRRMTPPSRRAGFHSSPARSLYNRLEPMTGARHIPICRSAPATVFLPTPTAAPRFKLAKALSASDPTPM